MSFLRPCLVMAVALSFGVAGCATTSSSQVTRAGSEPNAPATSTLPPEGREIIVNVAPQRSPCTGVGEMLCLQVRTRPGAPWELYYGQIEGFDWQSGVEYVIRVRELPVANPPADGSSLRWVLEEILERDPPR